MTTRTARQRYRTIAFHLATILGLVLVLTLLLYLNERDQVSPPSFGWLFLQAGTGVIFSFLPPVYFNLYWLIPYCLERKRYLLYAFAMLLTIVFWGIFISQFEPWTDQHWFDGEPESQSFGTGIAAMVFLMLLTTFLNLSYRWFTQLAKVREMENDRLQMELALLKDQINPHFFFNTLNNLYALSLEQSEETPHVILKLSEMMRYTIYDCKASRVSIADEVRYIQNYIELQEIRRHAHADIVFAPEIATHKVEIAPMILIVFVENAFKHGFETVEEPEIHISLQVSPGKLSFRVTNRFVPTAGTAGMGLANVRKRLELEYPKAHQLRLTTEADLFVADLEIELK